jgi:hypothetical protein
MGCKANPREKRVMYRTTDYWETSLRLSGGGTIDLPFSLSDVTLPPCSPSPGPEPTPTPTPLPDMPISPSPSPSPSPTPSPTPIVVTNVNNNQVRVRNDGGYTVKYRWSSDNYT